MNTALNFGCTEDFADYIINRLEEDGELFVEAVGKFETIKPLLKEVMTYESVDFENIEIESKNTDGYADEFVLSFWVNDRVIEVGCEKLKRDGEYIYLCGDETYLMEDCSTEVLSLCEATDVCFVYFDEESDCGEGCCQGCCECADDGDVYGFVADTENDNGHSKIVYYSSIPVNKSDIKNILKNFGF